MNSKKNNGLPIWVFLFLLNGIALCAGFFLVIFECVESLKTASQIQTEQNLKIFSYSMESLLFEVDENLDGFVKDIAKTNADFRITVVSEDGSVIADSDAVDISLLENHASRPEVAAALDGREGKGIHHSTVNNTDVMYYAIPFNYANKNMALRLSMPMKVTTFLSGREAKNIVFFSVIILALVLGASFIISAFIVRQINILKEASLQYQKGNFNFRAMITSPRELKTLGESFGSMASVIQKDLENLKRLEQVRTDFVANVSHELKTPVTSIKGFIETLLDGALDDKETAEHFLKIMDAQSGRLINIIEDLLDLSRLEEDKQSPSLIRSDIVSITKNVTESFRKAAAEKNISLEFNCDDGIDKKIFALLNEGLYSQALGNLFDNALKYCPENSTVSCSVKEVSSANSKTILVVVEDDGPGIPELYRGRIFERFFRVDKSRSRSTGGTGLGLSIVAHIIKIHGGNVVEKNRIDNKNGARFEIVLPEV